MAATKTSNQSRASTKIVFAFLVGVAALFGGARLYSNWRVSNIHFTEIAPKEVNIVGVNLDKGFRIIVANQVAQLIRVDEKDPGANGDHAEATDNNKSRVPMREMLKALQGNEEALGYFVMALNGVKQDTLPPIRVNWKQADILKALSGDPVLTAKLEKDLNAKLDGTPLPEFRPDSMWNGIVIEALVPVQVNVAGTLKTLNAPYLIPFKTDLMANLERELGEKAHLDREMMGIHYTKMAEDLLKKNNLQNISQALKDTLDPKRLAKFAVDPERVLKSATVLVNEDYVKDADLSEGTPMMGSGGKIHKLYNLTIDLTNEGVDRLWYYSKNRVGSQLLIISNGVAIGAPRIQHELSEDRLQISQMEDYSLAKDAVDTINKHKAAAK